MIFLHPFREKGGTPANNGVFIRSTGQPHDHSDPHIQSFSFFLFCFLLCSPSQFRRGSRKSLNTIFSLLPSFAFAFACKHGITLTAYTKILYITLHFTTAGKSGLAGWEVHLETWELGILGAGNWLAWTVLDGWMDWHWHLTVGKGRKERKKEGRKEGPARRNNSINFGFGSGRSDCSSFCTQKIS